MLANVVDSHTMLRLNPGFHKKLFTLRYGPEASILRVLIEKIRIQSTAWKEQVTMDHCECPSTRFGVGGTRYSQRI